MKIIYLDNYNKVSKFTIDGDEYELPKPMYVKKHITNPKEVIRAILTQELGLRPSAKSKVKI